MIQRTWKQLKDYEGIYDISNLGEIKRLYREWHSGRNGSQFKTLEEGLVKSRIDSNGYELVNLSKDGVKFFTKVHRLVANNFIENPNNYPVINHKDGNKTNNCVDNLEWTTYKNNTQHAIENNLVNLQIKSNNIVNYTLVKEMKLYYLQNNCTKKEVSKFFNVEYTTTVSILNNKIWKNVIVDIESINLLSNKKVSEILDNNDIILIRNMYEQGITIDELCYIFNRNQGVICSIITHKTYKNI